MGTAGHAAGQTGQLCHLDAVAVIGGAAHDAPQKSDILAALFHGNIIVFHAVQRLLQLGQFVVMGGKQRFAAQAVFLGRNMLHHSAGNAHAVKCRGSAADLVQNHKAFGGGLFQDLGHLGHFHHKSGLARRQIVRSAHSGENGIHHADMAFTCRNKAADLRHQRNNSVLAHISRFTGHVGAGDDQHTVVAAVQMRIVGHKQCALEHLLHHGMPPLGDPDGIAIVHRGLYIVVIHCSLRQRSQHIQRGHGLGRCLHPHDLPRNFLQDLCKKLMFQRVQAFACAQNFVFEFLQLLRDISLAAGKGLLADKALGHLVFIRIADFNVIAEHPVEADLQLGNAGFLAQAGFQLGKHTLAAVHDVPQLVHLLVVARLDHAAVL